MKRSEPPRGSSAGNSNGWPQWPLSMAILYWDSRCSHVDSEKGNTRNSSGSLWMMKRNQYMKASYPWDIRGVAHFSHEPLIGQTAKRRLPADGKDWKPFCFGTMSHVKWRSLVREVKLIKQILLESGEWRTGQESGRQNAGDRDRNQILSLVPG